MLTLTPHLLRGSVVVPPSKSHAHRLLIANFLAGDRTCLLPRADDSDDIAATRRCLAALAEPTPTPTLVCGESGSTLRFLAPVAAARGKTPTFVRAGRLAARPFRAYPTLTPGLHELPGDISSQFVTGLLFALPLLTDDSRIRFTSPLESRGYVDMTLRVLRDAGVVVCETDDGFDIPGGQRYHVQPMRVAGDWSGGAFWLAANALGSALDVRGLADDSEQPDRAIVAALAELACASDVPPTIDMSQFPDSFPILTVVAAARHGGATFTGIRRLRLKECDRVAAMDDVLTRLGRRVIVRDADFVVSGSDAPFRGGTFSTYGDHRIAMSVAIAATRADGPVTLDNANCAAKSYPDFFDAYARLSGEI